MGVLEVEARIWVLLLYSGFMAGWSGAVGRL